MKSLTSLALAALAAGEFGAAQATAPAQLGPFYLLVKGVDNDLDGYLGACHTGAALEALCYSPGPVQSQESNEFYFNNTMVGSDNNLGVISWHLPVPIDDSTPYAEQPMTLNYLPNSNVAYPTFGFETGTTVGYDDDGAIYVYATFDDSTFTPDVRPQPGNFAPANWNICYQYIGGYYYQSLGFATTTPPHNPTCQAVQVTIALNP